VREGIITRYEGNIYSPNIEADDYVLQCTIGCSHNKCTFCDMYKDKKYRVRELDEIINDINLAKEYYGDIEKVFLADGDALTMATDDLSTVLDYLYNSFPSLKYVGTYASTASILGKTLPELIKLQNHGLVEAHLGIESGDEKVLSDIKKGVTYCEIVEAGKMIREAGIRLFATVILGLAGRTAKAFEHARNTARICNDIQPDYIGVLTILVQPGTELYEKTQRGEFEVPTDMEIFEEMRAMMKGLYLENSGFTSIHSSNRLYIEGFLPADKGEFLNKLSLVIEGKDTSNLRSPGKTL